MSDDPGARLWHATAALHEAGTPLMTRVLPISGAVSAWRHYPAHDVVNGPSRARWFYHSHNPDDRDADEHGHFHLFVAREAMRRRSAPLIAPPGRRRPRPSLVHVAALAMARNGLPLRWFAPNRWVTDEWLYPAAAIAARIEGLSFEGEQGDPLVNAWIGAMLQASRGPVTAMLERRDALLVAHDPGGEDRAIEVAARADIDLDALFLPGSG